jgi:thiol:disulfide interchange protein DsbC
MQHILLFKAPVMGALLALLVSLSSLTASQPLQSSAVDDTPEVAAIRDVLFSTQNGIIIQAIVPSPVAGLYEVRVENGPLIYASADAQFFIPGDLYQATQNGLVNLGESRRNELRLERLGALDESDMIIFRAEGKEKAILTVFTDVDCQFCQRFHSEMPQLNELGITIRYLAFPRSGLDQVTYPKMVSTWCAEDRNVIFTTAVRGAQIAPDDCDNPVAEQWQMGREFGVTGTPTLVFEDGSMVPGYVPAEDLAAFLFTE